MPSVRSFLSILAACIVLGLPFRTRTAELEIFVVAHPNTPPVNRGVLQKIFLGKVIEVDGTSVIPVNLAPGDPDRRVFMTRVMEQDDEKFISYWTVRRYIGKGAPPREFSSLPELLDYVRQTPGAIGYSSGSAPKDGLSVLLKLP